MFFKYMGFIFLGFVTVFVGILQLPWTPQYPVIAKVVYQPHLMIIRAPISGVIQKQFIAEKNKIQYGDSLLTLRPINSVFNQNYQIKKLNYLNHRLQQLNEEIAYQKSYLSKVESLLSKKVITEDEYHFKKNQYQKIILDRDELLENILELNHQRHQILQAPVDGTILQIFGKNGEMVRKSEKLAIIKPKHIQFLLKCHLPISYQNKVFLGQKLRLSRLSSSPIKDYLIQGQVKSISPYVKADQVKLTASMLNADSFEKYLLSNQPLEGYLIGKTKPLWYWLWRMFKGGDENE
jgi:biotin carboxyl carrier protein